MTDRDLYEVLDRAADPVGEVDLLVAAWAVGCRQRRRRRAAWVASGGVLVAATLLGAVPLVGWLSGTETPAPAGQSEAPEPGEASDTAQGPDSDVRRGAPAVLVLGDNFTLGDSRTLDTATTAQVEGGQWQLMDGGLRPIYPQGVGVRLTHSAGEWAVRACGLDIKVAGGVADGRVELTDDWQILPDPDPGASCVGGPWHSAGEWQDLMATRPWVGTTDGTLVLAGWAGQSPQLVEASMAFARADEPDPRTGPESPVTFTDLEDEWVEVPAERARAALTDEAWVDADPAHRLRLQKIRLPDTGEVLSLQGCNDLETPAFWSVSGGTLVLGATSGTDMMCYDEAALEDRLAPALFGSYPRMRLSGDYLVVTGGVPEEFVPGPLG